MRASLTLAGENRQMVLRPVIKRFILSASELPLRSDRTAHGEVLECEINVREIGREVLQQACDASFGAFEEAHGGLVVSGELRMLVRPPGRSQDILSASDIIYSSIRAEVVLGDCLFRYMTFMDHLAQLRGMQSTVSRAIINACRAQARESFNHLVVESLSDNEDNFVSRIQGFLFHASLLLSGGDVKRSIRLQLKVLAGARGIAAKQDPRTGDVDQDAGFRGETDFVLPFGHPAYAGKILLAGEAKYSARRPNLSRPWHEVWPNHFPQLMGSMVGHLATVGVAICPFGMKTFLIQTPSPGGPSAFSVSPPGENFLDFSSPGAWDLAFEWWLEIAALAVPPSCPKAFSPAVAVAVPATHPQATLADPPSRLIAPVALPNNRTLYGVTRQGKRVEFASENLKETLHPDEYEKLLDSMRIERQQARERRLFEEDDVKAEIYTAENLRGHH